MGCLNDVWAPLGGLEKISGGSQRDPRGSQKVSGNPVRSLKIIEKFMLTWYVYFLWALFVGRWGVLGSSQMMSGRSGGFSKRTSGGVLKVSGNCRKVPGAFSDAEMESVIYMYFFRWSLRALGSLGRLK